MSPLVENMALSAAGSLVDHPAYGRAESLGQGSASGFFSSIGSDIEARCGAPAGVRAMETMATIMAFLEITDHDADLDDLVLFFVERIRHNSDRLFLGA